ncbi:zinc ABC transporter substrate-binding protein [Sulfitobacter sp. LCG007]
MAASALLPAAARAAGVARPLAVVATTGMIADGVARIGGDQVEIHGLMGAGVDPHSYRQTRSDIVAMSRADLVLWHGLYLEAQMEEFFADLSRKREVVAVAEVLTADRLLSHPAYEGRYDPHVWMAPPLWGDVLAGIADVLVAKRPEAEELFASNRDDLLSDVAGIDAYARHIFARLDPEQRVLVTAHDAFSYFGREYGFEVIGIQGISTESEAGLNRVGELVDLLVERGIRAAFVESSVSDRNIRALIEGAAARGHEVKIGGELFSDAMGVPGTYEGTYIGMMDHNLTTIARALGADVDPLGWQGKLRAGS